MQSYIIIMPDVYAQTPHFSFYKYLKYFTQIKSYKA